MMMLALRQLRRAADHANRDAAPQFDNNDNVCSVPTMTRRLMLNKGCNAAIR
jgi:hypothetical protein